MLESCGLGKSSVDTDLNGDDKKKTHVNLIRLVLLFGVILLLPCVICIGIVWTPGGVVSIGLGEYELRLEQPFHTRAVIHISAQTQPPRLRLGNLCKTTPAMVIHGIDIGDVNASLRHCIP